jgi:hypothetical protein
MTERRTARRYDLTLPVNVRSPLNREPGAQSGRTRDISARGVYFIIEKELSAGAEIDFTLTLPAEVTRGTEVFVRAHGRVVRVVRVDRKPDDARDLSGVAAIIDRYGIIRRGEEPARG